MSQFTQFTGIEPVPKTKLWKVDKPLYREIGSEGSNEFIIIPEGFVFDGATIPLIITMLTGMQKVDPQTILGAGLHDYGYVKKTVRIYQVIGGETVRKRDQYFTRKERDVMYLQAIIACGYPKIKAYTQYYGIRAGGYPVWKGRIHTT